MSAADRTRIPSECSSESPRIAYEPFPFLGHATDGDVVFCLHGWTANYQEVSTEALSSVDALRALVTDVGFQLGRGHVSWIAAPLDRQLRSAVLAFVETHEDAIRTAVATLATELRDAHERFVTESEGRCDACPNATE